MGAPSTSTETGTEVLESAESQIESLLDEDGNFGEPPTKKVKTAVSAGDDDDDDDDDGGDELEELDLDEEADDESEDDESDDEEQDEDDEDEDESDEPREDAEVTVKIDGKTEKLTLAELKKGYSRTKVFTQRTQEAANLRKEAEALSTQLQSERAQLAQIAAALEAQMQNSAGDPEPDWAKLRAEDPVEWAIKRQEHAEKQEQRDRLKQVETELSRRNAEAQQAALSETIKAERTKLLEKIPEWQDEAKASKDMADLRAYMAKQGFSDEEMAQIYDHRAVVVLRKAMRLDRLTERQQALAKSGKPTKVIQKTLVPGRGKKATSKAGNAVKAMNRAKQTGSMDDAQRAVLAIPGLI